MSTNPAPSPHGRHVDVIRQPDVAELWKVSTRTVRNWTRRSQWDRIPPPRTDAGGKPYWIRDEVVALLIGTDPGAPSLEAAGAVIELSAEQQELLEMMDHA